MLKSRLGVFAVVAAFLGGMAWQCGGDAVVDAVDGAVADGAGSKDTSTTADGRKPGDIGGVKDAHAATGVTRKVYKGNLTETTLNNSKFGSAKICDGFDGDDPPAYQFFVKDEVRGRLAWTVGTNTARIHGECIEALVPPAASVKRTTTSPYRLVVIR